MAFIVCDQIGIESDEYRFGYVATWAGGDTEVAQKAIRESGSRIQKTADQILTGIQSADVGSATSKEVA